MVLFYRLAIWDYFVFWVGANKEMTSFFTFPRLSVFFYNRGWQTFFVKGQIVNLSGFVDHMVSVATTQLYCAVADTATLDDRAALDDKWMNGRECIPIKLFYESRQWASSSLGAVVYCSLIYKTGDLPRWILFGLEKHIFFIHRILTLHLFMGSEILWYMQISMWVLFFVGMS